MDENWEFVRRRAGRAWVRFLATHDNAERVDLPHCWNAEDTFQDGIAYYRGPGAYRRTVECPGDVPQGAAWLCAEGFYGVGDVWINGRRVARVDGQYMGFSLPVAGLLNAGARSQVAIRLTNRCSRWVLPGIRNPDFLLHGGLAGRVWVEFAGAVHLDERETQARAAVTATGRARLDVAAHAVNAGSRSGRTQTVWRVEDSDGAEVHRQTSRESVVNPGQRFVHVATLEDSPVRLWAPDHPCLYTVIGCLLADGVPVDETRRRIGFRSAEFRPDQGFFLNGEKLLLRGCNRHECLPGVGNALSDAMHRADARAIREMGLNFVRLSHYPQSPAFLDACDEMGVMVYAELASWKSVRNGLWLSRALRQFGDMIRRDRHHPSVVLWGMGNEARARRAYLRLRALARELGPDRPVTYAENHLYRARRGRTIGLADVWGCNYELDRLEEGRDAARLRTVIVSECSNAPHAVRGDPAAERGQISQLAADLPRIEECPFSAGFALWCFNDYPTLRKGRYMRFCGVVDAWREPKLAAAWLRARYGATPYIRIAADWSEDVGLHGATRRVDIFSTCAPVELRVNGRCVHTAGDRGHHALTVRFEPGRIEAVDARDGSVGDAIDSFGSARGLVLARSEGEAADAPRTLRLRVVDCAGHWVRDWSGEARVTVRGDARVFPYRADAVRILGGSARIHVDVAAPGRSGTWSAEAPGLDPAVLRL